MCVLYLGRNTLDMYRYVILLSLLGCNSAFAQVHRPVREHMAVRATDRDGKMILREADMLMVPVEGGTFRMRYWQCGTPDGREYANMVTVSGFYISRFETTELQWRTLMGDDYRITGCDSCPMVHVRWQQAVDFAEKVSQATGHKYRLPTNAEWEYASRGGRLGNGKKYAGSDYLGDVAWYRANSDHQVHRVGMKQPNELGLYDMLGNVDEWVSDWSVMQRPGTYVEQVTQDPTGPPTGVNKVYRGGEIFSSADDVLEWFPFHRKPDDGSAVIGFRLVREMKD